MSGWPSRNLLLAAAVATIAMTSGCARAEPTRRAVTISAKQESDLFAAYSRWRRAVTCATSWAPGPIAGVAPVLEAGNDALRRLHEAGQSTLLARLEAKYEEIDSRIDWVCGDGAGLTPPETAEQRLSNLEWAAAYLAEVVDGAIQDR